MKASGLSCWTAPGFLGFLQSEAEEEPGLPSSGFIVLEVDPGNTRSGLGATRRRQARCRATLGTASRPLNDRSGSPSAFRVEGICAARCSLPVSRGRWKEGPHAGWLKTARIYSPTVLEAESPPSGCGDKAMFPPEEGPACRSPPGPCHDAGRPWACRRPTLISSVLTGPCSLCVPLFPLLQGHQSDWARARLLGRDLIVTNYICNHPLSNQRHMRRSWGFGREQGSIRRRDTIGPLTYARSNRHPSSNSASRDHGLSSPGQEHRGTQEEPLPQGFGFVSLFRPKVGVGNRRTRNWVRWFLLEELAVFSRNRSSLWPR